MRVVGDPRRRIAGVVHQDFLRRDGDVHGVAERLDVERAVGIQILHQVERRQVAGRVVQEHVFRARIRGVDARRVLAGVPAVHRGVVLHAGIAAVPGGVGHAVQQLAGAVFFARISVVDVARPPVAVVLDRLHEFIGDADRVVGVLEEDGGVGLAVDRRIVALLDQHLRLVLFLHLAVDELDDVRMIHVQDHHLRGAARLAAGLDHAGERVETLHEADRPGGDAAAGKRFAAAAQRREIRARARAPLEQHPLGLGQVHDRFHVVLDRVDEAGRALRLGLHADVEPHRRVESHLLLDQQVRQIVAEGVARSGAGEVAALLAPADDRVHHAADELAHRAFALRRVELAVEIFRRDDVRRRLRPALRHFHVFLAENRLALFVADQRDAAFPFDGVERRSAAVGKVSLEFEASADLHIGGSCCIGLERRLFVQSHLRMCHCRLRAGGLPRAEGTLIFYSRMVAGSSQLPDSQQAAARFDGIARNFETSKKKKTPLRIRWPLVASTDLRTPRRQRWERRRRGVEGPSSMSRLCPAGCVRRCCGLPGVNGPSARRNHDPPNLRAQCKQTRNFCQGENQRQSTKSCCLVLKLSIPSGDVPGWAQREKTWRLRKNRTTLSEEP